MARYLRRKKRKKLLPVGVGVLLLAGMFLLKPEQQETVTVCYLGRSISTQLRDETVEALLHRLKLETEPGDMLSCPMDTPVTAGMTVRVDRVLQYTASFVSVLPRQTVYRLDSSLPEGTERVLEPGRDGEILCTADITCRNGEQTAKKLRSRILLTEPVNRIVLRGTGLQSPAAAEPIIENGVILLPNGDRLTYSGTAAVRATAYTHTDSGCDRTTATGSTVHIGTVAVDPRRIPYGTRMFIMASDGSYVYGVAEAEDCGGDIREDRVDLYLPTYDACMDFGRRNCTVYFLGEVSGSAAPALQE